MLESQRTLWIGLLSCAERVKTLVTPSDGLNAFESDMYEALRSGVEHYVLDREYFQKSLMYSEARPSLSSCRHYSELAFRKQGPIGRGVTRGMTWKGICPSLFPPFAL